MSARRWLAPLCGAALIAGAAGWTFLDNAASARAAAEASRHRPEELARDGYVSSRACRACHAEQYASWHDSYHRTMTQPARPDTVRAPFDGRQLEHGGASYTLSRRGDDFFVRDDAGGTGSAPGIERRVAFVTGSHHLQIYWYQTGAQRQLAPLAFAYLLDDRRFIPREAAFLRPPAQSRPEELGRWNTSCITCHTTAGVPLQDKDGGLDTRVAELGIACEACHGPGAEHVRANSSPLRRYARHLQSGDVADTTIKNPRRLDHRRVSEMCGQCHGVWQFRTDADYAQWNEHGFPYRPGDDPNATQVLFQPSLREAEPLVARIMQQVPMYATGTFWADGMERVSGREYNAMFESPCYQRGEMSCLSCHDMHADEGEARGRAAWANDQLALGKDGDAACVQCHEDKRDAQRVQAHTHHAAGSSGSACYNCHMPNTTYGLLGGMRSHQVSSPDVGTSVRTGRPNACNLCHLDRTLAWSAEQLQRWYGIAPPELGADERSVAASLLWSLRGDAGQRALLAWGMGWAPARRASGEDWLVPALAELLDDPYDAVRLIAARSLHTFDGFERLELDATPPPSARPRLAPSVLASWRARPPGAAPRPELLQSAPRVLDADRWSALIRARDNRAVHLLE